MISFKTLRAHLEAFRTEEDGAALAEYALIMGVILVVGGATLAALGNKISPVFTSAAGMLP